MELSVIIPAKNEENRIEKTLESTVRFLEEKGIDYEVLVVDDGSTDKTRDVVAKFRDKHVAITPRRENRGKGYSVREGMLKAKKQYALFMDADNSTSIEEIEGFIPHMVGHDILIGSRNLKGSNIAIKQPWLRSTLGKMFPWCVRIFAVRGIKDTQCGFKWFNKKAIAEVFPRSRLNRWGFDVELLFIAKRKGLTIKELPITWKNDGQSKVNPFKDSIDMFLDLMRIRYNSLKGRYR